VSVLVLTYHAIGRDRGPLAIEPELFAAQLDCLADAGAQFLTVSEIAAALRSGDLPGRGVAVTFDDGMTSVAENAAPLLAERGLTSTVF